MLRAAWRLARGYRLCPWRSPYLRWRIETYSGIHADQIDFGTFWKFAGTPAKVSAAGVGGNSTFAASLCTMRRAPLLVTAKAVNMYTGSGGLAGFIAWQVAAAASSSSFVPS